MPELGRWLVVVGLGVALLGALLWAGPSIPWLGRLPGDVRIERPGATFYFPLGTSLLLSVVLSLVLWLVSRFRG